MTFDEWYESYFNAPYTSNHYVLHHAWVAGQNNCRDDLSFKLAEARQQYLLAKAKADLLTEDNRNLRQQNLELRSVIDIMLSKRDEKL